MIVVSDTSPLNYLILIRCAQVLPDLFGQAVVPPAVVEELKAAGAPVAVSAWINNPPGWLEVRTPNSTIVDRGLGSGENEALALAQELSADVLLIDDRDGVRVARRLGLFAIGTLGVLAMAAEKKLLHLPDALAALSGTTFRGPQSIIDELLAQDAQRRATEG